jgi:hypothetical protein
MLMIHGIPCSRAFRCLRAAERAGPRVKAWLDRRLKRPAGLQARKPREG